MCLMSFTHAEILKSYPYEILDGEKISFDYIESDKCNFQRKDLKSSINRILEINKIDLGSGNWMHVPYECWNIKNSKEDLFLKLTKTTKHAKRHFWLTDVCTCHGLLPSHSA